MKTLVLIEVIVLLAGVVVLWRRTRRETPRRGRSFAFVVLALAIYIGFNAFVDATLPVGAARSPHYAMWVLFGIQVARVLLLAWAAFGWLEVVRPRLARSWRGVLTLIGFFLVAYVPASTVGMAVMLLLPFSRLKWTRDVHGWGRFGLVIAFGALTFALSPNFAATVWSDGATTVSTVVGAGTETTVDGTLPAAAAALLELVRPWENAVRVLLFFLRLALAVAFFQLLVVPIRLRGLSLRTRFTVTLAMYRFIPGTLALVFMLLIAYLGVGLHRASVVADDFDAVLQRAVHEAGVLSSRGPATAPPRPDAIHPGERWFAVVRNLEWTHVVADGDTTQQWVPRSTVSSPGTPRSLRDTDFFAGAVHDSASGIVERGGVVYLRGAVINRDGARATTATAAEVFAEVDSTYLSRLATKIKSDVRLDVSPHLFVGETEVRIVTRDEKTWADSAFAVSAPFAAPVAEAGWLDRRAYLARTFLPVGDWRRAAADEGPIGAVQLRLYTTPRGLLKGIGGNSFLFTSQVFAIIILLGIAFLFIVVELSAVRTGRSIVKGIISDVRTLTDAAARFGRGELNHRVDLSGQDEMGRLASTFNSMAESIEANQELLLEKERLEADLALAREIQQRMLPQSPPSIPGLDVAGLSIPSREVGGDLFYFLPVSNGRLGVTIGDVSGKSVPAALLMSNVLAALKSEARIVDREDEILGHLNRLIVEQVEPGRFVTFFYGVVDPAAHTVRYACAGHNPPLLVGASGESRWLHEAGMPLGVRLDTVYTPHETPLEPGDVLVLYSDGVTEAQKPHPADAEDTDAEGEFFDEHRLEAVVKSAHGKSAAGVIADVMEAVRSFTGNVEQSDDLTLVVVRVT